MSTLFGLSIGFWPIVHTVSENGSVVGLAFLIAWSVFFIPVIARSIPGIWHRQWAIALSFGVLLYAVVFLLGDGITYVGDSVLDIPDGIRVLTENTW